MSIYEEALRAFKKQEETEEKQKRIEAQKREEELKAFEEDLHNKIVEAVKRSIQAGSDGFSFDYDLKIFFPSEYGYMNSVDPEDFMGRLLFSGEDIEPEKIKKNKALNITKNYTKFTRKYYWYLSEDAAEKLEKAIDYLRRNSISFNFSRGVYKYNSVSERMMLDSVCTGMEMSYDESDKKMVIYDHYYKHSFGRYLGFGEISEMTKTYYDRYSHKPSYSLALAISGSVKELKII